MTKRPRAKISEGKRLPATRVDVDLYNRVAGEAAAEFCHVTDIIRTRLERSYTEESGAPIVRDEAALERAKRVKIDNEIKEIELKKLQRTVVDVELVLAMVEQDTIDIRKMIKNWVHGLPGMTDEQMKYMESETDSLLNSLAHSFERKVTDNDDIQSAA